MRLSITVLLCLSSLACYCQRWNDNIDIRVTPGVDFASLIIANSPEFRNRNFRIGGEVDFILAFNNRRWSVMVEPAYQSFHQPDVDFQYESIEVSLGLRRHFHLNDNIKVFVNAMSMVDKPLKHSQIYTFGNYGPVLLTDKSLAPGLALGGGIAIRRVSVEGRYYSQRKRQADQLPLQYQYVKGSIIFGFRLF